MLDFVIVTSLVSLREPSNVLEAAVCDTVRKGDAVRVFFEAVAVASTERRCDFVCLLPVFVAESSLESVIEHVVVLVTVLRVTVINKERV